MTHATFLPFVANAPIASQSEPQGRAAELWQLMATDPGQQRKDIRWHPTIAAVAQARCDAMLEQGAIFINHLDGSGRGPNKWLRDAGIAVPDWYSKYPGQYGPDDHENNVESIGLNYLTAVLCWQAWLGSPSHRAHVLGYAPTFVTQVLVGIGYARSPDGYPIFWILLSCPPEVTP